MDKFKKIVFQNMLNNCDTLEELENSLIPLLVNTKGGSVKTYIELKLNCIAKAASFNVATPEKWFVNIWYNQRYPQQYKGTK